MGENSWNGYERNHFYHRVGDGIFVEVGRAVGGDSIRDSRGFAVADLDADGRQDLVVNNNNAPPDVFLNRSVRTGHWLVVELAGRTSNRDAVGAVVRLRLGERVLTRHVKAGSGYASQSPYAVHFGLGTASEVQELEVLWPSGTVQEVEVGDVNRRLRIEEDQGNG